MNKTVSYADAIENAIAQAMSEDPNVIILGEDVRLLRLNLFSRFGKERVINTPISESAFLGAGVTAAMAGLRPIVEIMLIDFIGVAMDAILNHAAKVEFFSGNKWKVPLVVRASCGGGYGDGGQHEQALWGWLAHIPGLTVVVPSTPEDAGNLMYSAIQFDGPVIYMEHKLLSDYWRDYLGSGGRHNMDFNVPKDGEMGPLPENWTSAPFGKARVRKQGDDISIISLGVGVHRALEAAEDLSKQNITAEVIDLRTVVPLDLDTVIQSVQKTGHVIIVDEDYKHFGLSGEIAAVLNENNISCKFARIAPDQSIPYAHSLEKEVLPNSTEIVKKTISLLDITSIDFENKF